MPAEQKSDTKRVPAEPTAKGTFEIEKYPWIQSAETLGKGAMGDVYKVVLNPHEFARVYAASRIRAGDMNPRMIGVHYDSDDPRFEPEVRARAYGADRNTFYYWRMWQELNAREQKLASSGWVAALKVPKIHSSNPHLRVKRFEREAKSLYEMGDHPNIIKFIALETLAQGEVPVLVMEFYDSSHLGKILQSEGKLGVSRSLEIASSMLKGVHHAHTKGVVHRDLKPSNILVDGNWNVKLADFGLAKFLEDDGGTILTMAGQIAGTPAYIAPEQANPALGPLSEKTDVCSLGKILFEMVTGRKVHDEADYRTELEKRGGKETDVRELILLEAGDPAKRYRRFPRDIDTSIPPHVEEIIVSAIQKVPKYRTDCERLMKDINDALEAGVFEHTEPYKPPSEESETALIYMRTAAEIAERDHDERKNHIECRKRLDAARSEADVFEVKRLLDEAYDFLKELPEPKSEGLRREYAGLREGLKQLEGDLSVFEGARNEAMKISKEYEALEGMLEGRFYEFSEDDCLKRAGELKRRAEEHLVRIANTGLVHARLKDPYIARMKTVVDGASTFEKRLVKTKEEFIDSIAAEFERPGDEAKAQAFGEMLRRVLSTYSPGELPEKYKQLASKLEAGEGIA